MQLTGMIWDVDGTLTDTLPLCVAAFRRVFEPHLGRPVSDQEIAARFGASEEGMIRQVMGDGWHAGYAAYLAAYDELHDRYVRPFPRIEEALRLLRDRGVRLAVVTGKGPESAAITLRRLHLTPYFERVEVGSPEGPIKPRGMRAILECWGAAPGDCGYVGDTPYDMAAAAEVGLVGLGAGWARTATVSPVAAPSAAAIFSSTDELVAWVDRHAGDPLR